MKLQRKTFVTGSAAGLGAMGILHFPADAAEFTYKYANGWAASHPFTIRAEQAAGRILQDSNGRLQIRIFPAGILGSGTGMLAQARAGAIEIFDAQFNVLESSAPVVGLGSLSFAFSDSKVATDACDGAFGKALAAATSKLNLYVFARAWDGGFRQITNNVKPINTPDDLKGLKIRCNPSPVAVSTFRALGAAPTAIDGAQMYTAAQTHLVDGTDLPFPSVDTFKMYEVQKYGSVVNWNWTGAFLTANVDAWQKLPQNLRDIAERRFEEAALLERADMLRLNATSQSSLQSRGMAINQADIPQFKARVRAAGLYTRVALAIRRRHLRAPGTVGREVDLKLATARFRARFSPTSASSAVPRVAARRTAAPTSRTEPPRCTCRRASRRQSHGAR